MSEKIIKAIKKGDNHYVYGVVYAPLEIDSDGETMVADDIQKMAHDFLASGKVREIDVNHNRQLSGAEVVESFIARKGDSDYPEGAWVLGVRVPEGPLWDDINNGRLNGFSVDALVTKVPRKAQIEVTKVSTGATENSVGAGAIPHNHRFYMEFASDGRVVFGATDLVNGHSHIIKSSVRTEEAAEHVHRFFV